MTAARREPLIWLQLVGLGALPLELLLVLLLLAGSDPGPLPALERLLPWAIGGLAPAVLLWRRPADPFSLLLVQAPLRARSIAQRTLVAAPTLAPRLAGVIAGAGLLPVLWWIDARAALAGPLAPLAEANRTVALLLSTPLLAVIVWQVQQLAQAATLLYPQDAGFRELTPLTQEQLESQRLCLGLPLLLLDPLLSDAPPPAPADRSPREPTEAAEQASETPEDLPPPVQIPEHTDESDESPQPES